jgi:hypothetical protein
MEATMFDYILRYHPAYLLILLIAAAAFHG